MLQRVGTRGACPLNKENVAYAKKERARHGRISSSNVGDISTLAHLNKGNNPKRPRISSTSRLRFHSLTHLQRLPTKESPSA